MLFVNLCIIYLFFDLRNLRKRYIDPVRVHGLKCKNRGKNTEAQLAVQDWTQGYIISDRIYRTLMINQGYQVLLLAVPLE